MRHRNLTLTIAAILCIFCHTALYADTYVFKFPAGQTQFTDKNGTSYTADSNGLTSTTNPALVKNFLEAGFELKSGGLATVSHSYSSGVADWTLSTVENAAEYLIAASSAGAVNAIATPTLGKQFSVYNNTGHALTVKASGQTGVTIANGALVRVMGTGTDFIKSQPDTSTAGAAMAKLNIGTATLGAGTNGAAAGKTAVLMDDSPAGEFEASDADVACTTSATRAKSGSNSLKMAFTTAADNGDGCHDGVTNLDWSGDEFAGLWLYSTVATAAGDLVLDLTDDGGSRKVNVPALGANEWTWVNFTLTTTDAEKDVITDISIELSTAGATRAAAGAFDVFADAMYKWDDTEQEALGAAIIEDGVYSVLAILTAENALNTISTLTLYTDYFVKYVSGNDSIVWISDQSANSTLALYHAQ